jgi:hypothetical protein
MSVVRGESQLERRESREAHRVTVSDVQVQVEVDSEVTVTVTVTQRLEFADS